MSGKWLMRVLYGMLVVATVLAVASLAMVRPVGAAPGAPPQPMKVGEGCLITLLCYTYNRPCDSCMVEGKRGAQVWAVYRVLHPCWGYDSGCIIQKYIECIPCQY